MLTNTTRENTSLYCSTVSIKTGLRDLFFCRLPMLLLVSNQCQKNEFFSTYIKRVNISFYGLKCWGN